MTSLGKFFGPCTAARVAVALMGTVGGQAVCRGMPPRAAPHIFLPIRASQLPDPLPRGATLRTRTVHFPETPVPPDYFGWLTTRTQIRYGRSMGDFYPFRRSGVRLGAGTRFYMTYAAYNTSPDTRIAMRYDPRGTLAVPTLRDGFSGAPIALVGYGTRIGERWTIGVDAGAMLGRAMTVFPYDNPINDRPVDRLRPSQRINPLIDVTVALGF